MWLCTDLLQALKGEPLSSVFSTDGTLISASSAPHCGYNKAEIIPIGTNSILKKVRVSSTVISGCETFFSQKVRKLGVFLDQTLFLDCHITHLAKIMYLQLCKISRIRPFISVEAAKNSSLHLFCRSLTTAIHYWLAYATTNFRNSGDFKITQHG